MFYRYIDDELKQMMEESDSEYEKNSYDVSDDKNYIPAANDGNGTPEDSDIEQEMIIEQEEYDSDESVEVEPVPQNVSSIWIAKDETGWNSNPLPSAQTSSRNILRQRGGPTANSNLFTPDELFKSVMRPEICDIILRETIRKGKRVCDAFNNDLMNRFSLASGRSPSKTFQPFTEAKLLAFIGILIAAGVHRQNKENLDDMWKSDALPLIRAAMSRDRFKMILRFIIDLTTKTPAQNAHKQIRPHQYETYGLCWIEIWKSLRALWMHHHRRTIISIYLPY